MNSTLFTPTLLTCPACYEAGEPWPNPQFLLSHQRTVTSPALLDPSRKDQAIICLECGYTATLEEMMKVGALQYPPWLPIAHPASVALRTQSP